MRLLRGFAWQFCSVIMMMMAGYLFILTTILGFSINGQYNVTCSCIVLCLLLHTSCVSLLNSPVFISLYTDEDEMFVRGRKWRYCTRAYEGYGFWPGVFFIHLILSAYSVIKSSVICTPSLLSFLSLFYWNHKCKQTSACQCRRIYKKWNISSKLCRLFGIGELSQNHLSRSLLYVSSKL